MNINKIFSGEKYSIDILNTCQEVFGGYRILASELIRPITYIPMLEHGLFMLKDVLEVDGNTIHYFHGNGRARDIANKFSFIDFVPYNYVVSGLGISSHNVTCLEVGYKVTDSIFRHNYVCELLCIDAHKLIKYAINNDTGIESLIKQVYRHAKDTMSGKIITDPTYPGRDVFISALDLLDRSVFNSVMNDDGEPEEFNYDTCSDYYFEYLSYVRKHYRAGSLYPLPYNLLSGNPTISNFDDAMQRYGDEYSYPVSDKIKNDIRSHVRQKLEEESRLEEIVDNPDI